MNKTKIEVDKSSFFPDIGEQKDRNHSFSSSSWRDDHMKSGIATSLISAILLTDKVLIIRDLATTSKIFVL